MGVSWLELQELPERVVEDYIAVMRAEAERAKNAERKQPRRR